MNMKDKKIYLRGKTRRQRQELVDKYKEVFEKFEMNDNRNQ